ncbi:hypothetical protein ZIOFF_037893 [Zingiber officinale]|uniref:LOB domain-containing protein n=1 Tax=Zingiber officinale TaxID=94328 RepID=A0A8J5GL19_ZINOF|nr:hypothetical protein ZIOFF_037893 [Zingiber officinale]
MTFASARKTAATGNVGSIVLARFHDPATRHVRYGFVTVRGLLVIDGHGPLPPGLATRHRLKPVDFVHAFAKILELRSDVSEQPFHWRTPLAIRRSHRALLHVALPPSARFLRSIFAKEQSHSNCFLPFLRRRRRRGFRCYISAMISASSSSSTTDAPRNHKSTAAARPNQNNNAAAALVVPSPSVLSPSQSSSSSVSSHRPSSSSSGGGGGSGGASQACAVCKFQRRRCRPECLLAPFFPAKDAAKFQNAHRLFGVSNIQKIVRPLDPLQRAVAMETIIYESDMRAADPVSGCLGVVHQLQCQIRHDFAELEFVLNKLNACRAAATAASQQQRQVPAAIALQAAGVIADQDELNGIFAPSAMIHHPQQADHDQFSNNYFCYDDDDKEQSVLVPNSGINAANYNDDVINEHQKYLTLQPFQNHQGIVEGDAIIDNQAAALIADDDNELALPDGGGMFGSMRMRCSLQVDQLRGGQNPVEYVQVQGQEHDLKGAASLFTLTNYNNT